MIPIRYTRNLFLRAICVVYLFAFASFYIQIPGLYGDNGVLPARAVLDNSMYKTFSARAHYQPTLLWLAPYLGLDTNYALDVLALMGIFLAFTGFISQKMCTIPLYAALWSLYFSLYQVGQVFVTSQWDDLLLETGFLTLLVAPLLPGKRRGSKGTPKDKISLFLIKWLLFRFLVSSGLTKLLSGCPKWFDLTAMSYYFETTVLPTPLSWYAHHLPLWILKLMTITTHVVEIVIPFLFFVPIRSTRLSAFVIQVLFQIGVYLTGNFNFLNILITTLLVSLLDDQFFFAKPLKSNKSNAVMKLLGTVINILIFVALIGAVIVLFNLKISGNEIQSSVGFTRDQFSMFAKLSILYGIYIALATLGITIVNAFGSAIADHHGMGQKISSILQTGFYASLAIVLFMGSTYPLSTLHSSTNSTVMSNVKVIHNRLSKLHVVNNYGLFKQIPSFEGRKEIVLEGADHIDGPWHEYNFLYKPGNVNYSLPFVAPYSPRLDWQMWWTTQSSPEKEPWLLSLVHRLLLGKPEVLNLLDKNHMPYAIFGKPPKFIRGVLYRYKYTPWNERWGQSWWKREKIGEYFPAHAKDSASLLDTLKARNMLPNPIKREVHPLWQQSLDSIRYVTGYMEASLLMWSIFTAGCAIITTTTRNK
nr:lipase maturation factor 2-like [Onthophagus taurus]